MRINIVSGPFYPSPPAPTGAVQRIWFDLARLFVRRGHSVKILSCGYHGFPKSQTVDGVDIRRLITFKHTPSTKANLAKDLIYSLQSLASLPRADITVTNCFWLPAIMTRVPFRKRWGKVVVCVQRVPKGQFKMYLRCDRLHAVSSAIARWIIEEQPGAAPITKVIANPIDVEHFRPMPSSGHRQDKTLLYTGRIHPEKGLDLLLRALPIIRQTRPEVGLRLIGPTDIEKGGGGDAFVDSLKALAPGQPVRFEPAIYDRAQLADALRQADLYCYPSVAERGEASPVAPLEAMGVGLVPICSDLPQFRDYLDEGVNGVTFNHRAPDAPALLARQVCDLLDHPAKWLEMSAAAAATAAAHSNQAIADQFLQDFQTLLDGVAP
jgi:glycosyltransferase involved in cell wall biosynthesis